MSEIVDFLLARLAEDESALPADDSGKRSTSRAWWSNDFEVVFIEEDRWRAEVEAKRRIVDRHQRTVTKSMPVFDEFDSPWAEVCAECGTHRGRYHAPCLTLRLLALPYADHPDYRQEWRP